MTRVAVAADSAVVRAGILALLSADPALVVVDAAVPVAVADDEPATLAERVAHSAPDVVVWAPWRLDDHALATLREDPAETDTRPVPVVLLADLGEEGTALRALRAGVASVLSRDASAAELAAAVHAAGAGLTAVPAALARELVGAAPPRDAADTGVALTPREREVLALLAAGLANKAIAPRLDISEHTVKAHVAAIYHKLGAGNRAEAVVAAARRGLILL